MFRDFFKGKSVFVTGHTGFKGSWLCSWLLQLGANVTGYSLAPEEHEVLFRQLKLSDSLNDLRGDVRDFMSLRNAFTRSQPDVVFHLAAQPLVRRSYQIPRETFEINVLGTCNLLDSLIGYPKPCSVVVVTTDKCYQNREWVHSYREEDPVGGHDPYSASKACAELVASSYRSSFFNSPDSLVNVATARAGNVIGGGDWAKDRIVPDSMRSVLSGRAVSVRNKTSTRPWQHVLEPLSGYLWLAANLGSNEPSSTPVEEFQTGFNFGPYLESNRTVADLVACLLSHTGGDWVDCSNPNEPHEASKLNLAIDKAFHLLGWKPTWTFEECIKQTASWYLSTHNGIDPITTTHSCILEYQQAALEQNIRWAITP
jgi:CDP-glucose 4,6-dehydratase